MSCRFNQQERFFGDHIDKVCIKLVKLNEVMYRARCIFSRKSIIELYISYATHITSTWLISYNFCKILKLKSSRTEKIVGN